jgi:hypothetical protein
MVVLALQISDLLLALNKYRNVPALSRKVSFSTRLVTSAQECIVETEKLIMTRAIVLFLVQSGLEVSWALGCT